MLVGLVGHALGLGGEMVRRRYPRVSLRRWSPADEALLRELRGRVSRREIAERLGRTPQAVASRACLLGLPRRPPSAKQS